MGVPALRNSSTFATTSSRLSFLVLGRRIRRPNKRSTIFLTVFLRKALPPLFLFSQSWEKEGRQSQFSLRLPVSWSTVTGDWQRCANITPLEKPPTVVLAISTARSFLHR